MKFNLKASAEGGSASGGKSSKLRGNHGFTLIEILIVIAIIGILASVVLVGLGPTQRKGRDARRISDLRQIQNGLELYYSKCGIYPGMVDCTPNTGIDFAAMADVLKGANLGINNVPFDPSGAEYQYCSDDGIEYTLAATLEGGLPAGTVSADTTCSIDCTANNVYCVTL